MRHNRIRKLEEITVKMITFSEHFQFINLIIIRRLASILKVAFKN